MSAGKLIAVLSLPLLLSAQSGPPDLEAYTIALRIQDPERRIEALTRWRADFPDSVMMEAADQAILSTLVRKLPEQTARIRKFAAEMYRKQPADIRGTLANRLALELLGADLLLRDAAEYARASIDSMSLPSYVERQIGWYRERGETPPWTRDLETRFLTNRAARVATLGRIELKLGHLSKSRSLLEEAHQWLPENPSVLSALGELAAKAGDDAKALDYLVAACLIGQASPATKVALEALFRKQQGGSTEGLEAMLDREYRRRYPNPFKVAGYQPDAHRSDRVVLAEVFTGSSCAPCAAADLAFEGAMQRYSREHLVVLMYHQHFPRPDPMANPDTLARYNDFGAQGVPAFAIDGTPASGGGPRGMTREVYERIQPLIERQLTVPAATLFKTDAVLAANGVDVSVTIDRILSASSELKVQIALVEKVLRFSGENGIRFHPMVVRAMRGFALDPERTRAVKHSFDLDEVSNGIRTHLDAKGVRDSGMDRIDRADLAVVVFVQDNRTKRVLQARQVDLSVESAQ